MQQSPDAPSPGRDSQIATRAIQIRGSLVLAFLGLAVFLTTANVLLIRRNRDLQAGLQSARSQLELQPGVTAPPISGKDPHGDPLVIAYGQDRKKTIMLVFSPDCSVCDANWPNWERTLRTAYKEGARVVGVNLAPSLAQEYIDRHGLTGYPVIAQADPSSILSYNFRYTPQTIVIDADAKVQWVWTGELRGKPELEVDRILGSQSLSMKGLEAR